FGRTVINLAPADLRKDAGAFDLPIAIGFLISTGQITAEKLDAFASVGELALDGTVRPVAGALSMAMEARARDIKRLIVPTANAREAAVVREIEVSACRRWRTRSASSPGSRPSSPSRPRPMRWKGSSTATTSISPT